MRAHIESTGRPLTGWDKKPTERPTAFMMLTKFAGVLVCKVGPQRQLPAFSANNPLAHDRETGRKSLPGAGLRVDEGVKSAH